VFVVSLSADDAQGNLKDVATNQESITLLLLLFGSPDTVAQITAPCVAHCGQTCKELRGVKGK